MNASAPLHVNRAFLSKANNEAQRLSIAQPFCQALHQYITANTDLIWDDDRALFWVLHPFDGMQVAVWLMPIACRFHTLTIKADPA